MTGMISYSDAPLLHDMVDNRNFRLISIFEVLTQNRNENDFHENLGLLVQVTREGENEQEEQQVEETGQSSSLESGNDDAELQDGVEEPFSPEMPSGK